MASFGNIIAVGGGKGGVGKSILAANMAVALALTGRKVILVDADYGASNLHALLGIKNPRFGLRDFFDRDSRDIDSLTLDTGISSLKFLSGAGDLPGSSDLNIRFQNKLIAGIKNLKADLIVMDLGPGTSFHVIDYFNVAHQNVVLSTPEMTSILNTFSFIKASLFRRISQHFKTNSDIQRLLDFSRNPELSEECYEVNTLLKKVTDLHPHSVKEIERILRDFQPSLIINRVRKKKDVLVGNTLVRLVNKYLNIETRYLGYLVESDQVRDSVDEMIPFLIKDPASLPSENLQQIISALTHSEIHLIKKDGAITISKQTKLTSGWGS